MISPSVKRSISVVPPENQSGDVEYKRHVHHSSVTRLRSLATQMSYRLDEGNGSCVYQIGVEDDGCHSLMDYEAVAESARILECIARSLNAVVLERRMIQNEVVKDSEGSVVKGDIEGITTVEEPSVFELKKDMPFEHEEEEEALLAKSHHQNGKANEDDYSVRLQKEPGYFTRCEITIQRVETHLLDPSPISLSELAADPNASVTCKPPAEATSPSNNGGTTNSTPQPKKETTTISETLSSRNIRVAVVGNVDAGKSTIIGTLTTSSLDDGRGKSRTSIMRHRHEIESGRTSTATTHLMGFRSTGEPITGKDQVRANKRKSEDEIARESYRIVTLMDLAGHEKYLKTTIHGVSSGMSDYALILVNSRHPPTHMTQHHLNLCCSFGIPVIVVFTKIDGCPEHAFKTSKEEVMKLLRSPEVGKKPFAVRNEQDVSTCMGKLHTLAPMIETSCVTGKGIDLLQKMLFSLPKRRRHENKANRPFEFLVEDIFNVPGVGAVVSGFVNAGELSVGASCHVYVGPTDDGGFMKTVAKSAHIARINTSHITSGQSACLAFSLNKELRKKLRRGMVVLKDSPSSTREFDAEICVLKGEGTTIRRSYQAYVHILNVRQSAFARNIEIVNHNALGLPPSHSAARDDETGIVLRPGSRAKVRFEFAQRPEYIRPGMRMLFRDGRVRGVGIITAIPKVQPVTA
ncbi:GTP-binding protein 1 (Fragment) [Seminavis robusta]|uniref:Elongation factor Tu, chloroplastic n=1 Tax=Seminavis robusta TaxID=568900 RepID=A0A9N8HB17_9STRA